MLYKIFNNKFTFFNYIIFVLTAFLSVVHCKKSTTLKYGPLKIGSYQESIDKIYINAQSVRNIILSGGDKNYTVSVERSDLVNMKIYEDTLWIKGLLEGNTFATVSSADYKNRIEVHVIPQSIFFSQDTIYLYPGYGVDDQNTKIQLSGGGEAPIIKVHDTDNIISVKWDARSNYLNIISYKEGIAYINANSQDGTQSQRLVVIVRAEDADSIYKTRGVYKTTNRTTYPLMKVTCIQPLNTSSSASTTNDCKCNNTSTNIDTHDGWIITWPVILGLYERESMGSLTATQCISMTIKNNNPTTLKKGMYIQVTTKTTPSSGPIADKTYNLFVEHISGDSLVTLRGSGVKYVLPYSTKNKSK